MTVTNASTIWNNLRYKRAFEMMRKNRNPVAKRPNGLDELLQRGFRYALALTHQAAQAEDLVQDACLKLLSRSKTITLPLLFKTIRNRFIDLYRHARRFPTDSINSDVDGMELPLTQSTPGNENTVVQGDMISKSLGKLSMEEREAFFLWSVEGYTAKEIAKLGGLSRNTVLSRISRARKKLRHILHEFDTEVAP